MASGDFPRKQENLVALISKNPDKYDPISPPHEPDAWFKIRPLSGGDIRELGLADGDVQIGFGVIARVVLAWSYSEPITPESIDSLDLDTTIWLGEQIKARSNIRDGSERESLASGSSPTSGPAEEPSRANSSIS